MFKRFKKDEGFALLELVAATGVLIVMMAGMSAAVVAGMRSNACIRERDEARESAREVMEDIFAWGDIDTLVAEFDDLEFPAGELDPTGEAQLPGTVEVDATNPNLLDIVITVRWAGIVGDSVFELRTSLARTSG